MGIMSSSETSACPACSQSLQEKTLSCNHSFHVSCIDAWINEKASCPVCRRSYDSAVSANPTVTKECPICLDYISILRTLACGHGFHVACLYGKSSCPQCEAPFEQILPTVCIFCSEGVMSEDKTLPCGHSFHESCISPWLSEYNSCPECCSQVDSAKPFRKPYNCHICFKKIIVKGKTLACGHKLDESCVSYFLSNSNLCPICNMPDSVHSTQNSESCSVCVQTITTTAKVLLCGHKSHESCYNTLQPGLEICDECKAYHVSLEDSYVKNLCLFCCKIVEHNDLILLPCGHKFHQRCSASWLHEQSICPECLVPISSTNTRQSTSLDPSPTPSNSDQDQTNKPQPLQTISTSLQNPLLPNIPSETFPSNSRYGPVLPPLHALVLSPRQKPAPPPRPTQVPGLLNASQTAHTPSTHLSSPLGRTYNIEDQRVLTRSSKSLIGLNNPTLDPEAFPNHRFPGLPHQCQVSSSNPSPSTAHSSSHRDLFQPSKSSSVVDLPISSVSLHNQKECSCLSDAGIVSQSTATLDPIKSPALISDSDNGAISSLRQCSRRTFAPLKHSASHSVPPCIPPPIRSNLPNVEHNSFPKSNINTYTSHCDFLSPTRPTLRTSDGSAVSFVKLKSRSSSLKRNKGNLKILERADLKAGNSKVEHHSRRKEQSIASENLPIRPGHGGLTKGGSSLGRSHSPLGKTNLVRNQFNSKSLTDLNSRTLSVFNDMGESEIRNCTFCRNLIKHNKITLTCGHTFHAACIKIWHKEHKTCPLCLAVCESSESKCCTDGEEMSTDLKHNTDIHTNDLKRKKQRHGKQFLEEDLNKKAANEPSETTSSSSDESENEEDSEALKKLIAKLKLKDRLKEKRLEEIEEKERKTNLIFKGISHLEPNSYKETVSRFCTDFLGLDVSNQIETVFPIGRKDSKNLQLKVVFKTVQDTFDVLNRCNRLKGTEFFVTRDYPKTVRLRRNKLLQCRFKIMQRTGQSNVSVRDDELVVDKYKYTWDSEVGLVALDKKGETFLKKLIGEDLWMELRTPH